MSPAPLRIAPLRIAIDTGGTFTDCVWVEGGRLRLLKVFSTPADPSQAIVNALRKIGHRDDWVLLHGTAVGTNTLLQRKGARVAFVTTAGFEDSIEIGRQARPRLYDFFFERIPPLVAGDMRFGVAERTSPEGKILTSPSPGALTKLARRIWRKQPSAIAISLLFSFANPRNEQQVARKLRRLKIPLSISHEILPEFREYERASTVVANAYLQPVMQSYLQRLQGRLPGRDSRAFVMQSSGGITALKAAAREPVRTVLSGPAGGMVGAAAMARRSGFERVITFDMGGTSTDVALVEGTPRAASEGEIAGLPVRVPMLDIHTVGAGGGSLARFDAAGALRVGPESAGADPGPICYGRGTQPTVTDANLQLGRLRPENFLGGGFVLDAARTSRIIREWLRRQRSSLSLEQFGLGVIRVVNANMERALRVVSIERGYDPRDFTLIAFGGAGGLHACELAQAMGIPRVLVPAMPGALSAYGILVSDVVKDYSRTVLWRIEGQRVSADVARRLRRELESFARMAHQDFRSEGWPPPEELAASADLRYHGQGYELNIPLRSFSDAQFLERFHREHHRRYGYAQPSHAVEIVTMRLRASRPAPAIRTGAPTAPSEVLSPAFAAVNFGGRRLRTAVIGRSHLRPGQKHRGPAVITEYSATTVVPPAMNFRLDATGNLLIEGKN